MGGDAGKRIALGNEPQSVMIKVTESPKVQVESITELIQKNKPYAEERIWVER